MSAKTLQVITQKVISGGFFSKKMLIARFFNDLRTVVNAKTVPLQPSKRQETNVKTANLFFLCNFA